MPCAALTITANSFQKVYGAASPTLTVGYSGFVLGEGPANLIGSLALTPSSFAQSVGVAGSPYLITPSGYTSTNYGISYKTGTLTVAPAPLTVTGVDRQKVYDGLVYPFNTNPAPTQNQPAGAANIEIR